MVTRRQSLKLVVSALLAPQFARVPFAEAALSSKRATELGCVSCTSKSALMGVYAHPLDSAALLKHAGLPQTLSATMRSGGGAAIHLVESATGGLSFSVKDIELGGIPAIVVTRHYNSRSNEDRGLGAGWSFGFDDRLEVVGTGAQLHTASGEVINFTASSQGGLQPTNPGLTGHGTLSQRDDATWIEASQSGTQRLYSRLGDSFYLSRINQNVMGSLVIERDSTGRMRSITSTQNNASVRFEWSSTSPARVTALSDSTGRSVQFGFANGLLTNVGDVAGASWTYGYRSGLLVQAVDPESTTLVSAIYDGARVSEMDTLDGRISLSYDDSGSALAVTSTDQLGNRTLYTHNQFGQLTGARTTTASNTAIESMAVSYDSAQRATSIIRSDGTARTFTLDGNGRLVSYAAGKKWMTWTYDGSGNVVAKADPAGSTAFENDENGRPLRALSARPSRSFSAQYSTAGLSTLSSTKQTIALGYESSGQLSSVIDSKGGTYEYGYNAQGALISEKHPSGYQAAAVLDARGNLSSWADSAGNELTYVRDKRGALTEVRNTAGDWARAERDSVGRVVRLTNSSGQSRHFSYDAVGRLLQYQDAAGSVFNVEYADSSPRAKATQMTQVNGTRVVIRNARGRNVVVERTAITTLSQVGGTDGSSYDDGWVDPLHGKGLLGSFSGAASVSVSAASKKKKVVKKNVGPFLAAPLDDDDDDGGGGDDGPNTPGQPIGDDGGDDDDDDDSDGDGGGDCASCQSAYQTSCAADRKVAYQNALAASAGVSLACEGLVIATIESVIGAIVIAVTCSVGNYALGQSMINSADSAYTACMNKVPFECRSYCPE